MRMTLEEQIRCVRREIRLRQRVYPRLIATHRLTQAEADSQLAAMRAVLTTLEDLQPTQYTLALDPDVPREDTA